MEFLGIMDIHAWIIHDTPMEIQFCKVFIKI